MNEISYLIISQTVHALRSCTIHHEEMNSHAPCLIASTLLVRPPPVNSFTPTIYNLHPIPVGVNRIKYSYTNMPTTFCLNLIDQTLTTWNDEQKSKCIFSKVVQCEEEPTWVSLLSLPCMEQLFSADTSTSNDCEINRSINSQPAIINIVQDIWVFYSLDEVKHCKVVLYLSNSIDIITISEPFILRLPCGASIRCSNIQLRSSECTNNTLAITSKLHGTYKKILNFQYSIKALTSRLDAEYKARAIDSLQQLQLNLYDSTPLITKIF
ncbi:unnamed protein product [Rotaria sp. Silwood1]|nr:unnamed protein product [Rotaria sp. Silwood1]